MGSLACTNKPLREPAHKVCTVLGKHFPFPSLCLSAVPEHLWACVRICRYQLFSTVAQSCCVTACIQGSENPIEVEYTHL
jgi:hypothetical protein